MATFSFHQTRRVTRRAQPAPDRTPGCPRRPRLDARSLALASVVAVMIAAPCPAAAIVWPTSAGSSVPVCAATGDQENAVAIADGIGGAYAAWIDRRSGAQVYLQRLTRLGGPWPGWPADGIAISDDATPGSEPTVVSDGAGGVIVAWAEAEDLYAQRVAPNGALLWAPGGAAVCTASGTQFPPRSASDGAGGVVMAWEDDRGVSRDVYAQRLSAAGAALWSPDGVLVGGAIGDQSTPDIVAGTSGSTIIAWTDGRGASNDIYAQRLTAAGTAAWAANGALMVAAAAHQTDPRLAPDGTGGAYIVFVDQRTFATTGSDLYAQRVSSAGAVLWGATGVPVCTMGLNQEAHVAVATPSGVVVAWEDYRPGTLPAQRDVFAQKLYPNGMVAWATDGIGLAAIGGDQHSIALVSDGKRGVIAAWTDPRGTTSGDLYGARVDSAGIRAPGWIDFGTPIVAAAGDQQRPVLAADGAGGAIVVFREYSGGPDYDLRAQRIGRYGRPEVEPAAMIADVDGGSFVAWEDYSGSDADVRVQRFDARGAVAPGWPAGGVPVAGAAGNQQHPALCADGAGGVLVAWEDDRAGFLARDVYVQRLDGLGMVAAGWPADGIIASDPFAYDERRPRIATDGSGGAFVAWLSGDLLVGALLIQKIDGSGNLLHPGGPPASALILGHDAFAIAADGMGGLVAAYENFQSPRGVTVLRFDAAGTTLGDPIALSPDGMPQHEPAVIADGTGGAYIAWRAETGGGTTPSQIQAQHLDAAGAPAPGWPAGGLLIAMAAGNQYDLTLAPDGLGNAILAWTDERTAGIPDLYAQRVTSAGTTSWTAGGLAVSTAVLDQTAPVVVTDGGGGALLAWQDRRGGTTDLYAQRITAAGVVAGRWTAGGVLVAPSLALAVSGDQHALAIVSDGDGGAQILAYDTRGGIDLPDLRLFPIDAFALAGDHALGIVGVRDVPADQGGRVLLTWTPHVLDRAPAFDIAEYWVWRQVSGPLAMTGSRLEAEAADFATDRPRPGQVVRSESFPGYFWEFVAAQPASGFASGYTYVADTPSDSTAPDSPFTRFMVQARHRSVLAFWSSGPDSGRSVDNLAPAPPGAFAVHWFGGAAPVAGAPGGDAASETAAGGYATLHWQPSPEADFLEYRIHRGGSADFEPSPANLVATRRDTGYVDAGAPPSFYKLIAVDLHGNAGVAAAAAPARLQAPERSGGALRLAPPRPNPVRGQTSIAFTLPRAGVVDLAIHDAAGRRIRTLHRGALGAGEHAMSWDGADDGGRMAPQGIYYARLAAQDGRLTARIVLLGR